MLPGLIGTLQALEALKFLLNIGQPAIGELLHLDTLGLTTRKIKLAKNPTCPHCPNTQRVRGFQPLNNKPQPTQTQPPTTMHNPASPVPLLTVQELAHLLETAPESGTLIDVREPAEVAQAKIPGSQHIPLQTIPEAVESLDKNATYWMQCKSGMRSDNAAQYMLSIGFTDVHNVQGGIDAWINAGL